MSSLFYCRACDESFQASPGARCETCDSVLIPPPSSSSNTSAPESAETSSIPQTAEEIELNRDNLLDQFYRELLGEDLFEEITRSIQGQDPKRKIDVEYIKKAAPLVLDSRGCCLSSISLHIGPLSCLALPASFSFLPTVPILSGLPLFPKDSQYGEKEFNVKDELKNIYGEEILNLSPPYFLFLKRGVTSFVNKASFSSKLNPPPAAIIVSQSEGMKFPFLMSDSSSTSTISTIPILMISLDDLELFLQFFTTFTYKNKYKLKIKDNDIITTTSPNFSLFSTLRIGSPSCECVICQSPLLEGENVYKLSCKHTYHTDCLSSWITIKESCPICRASLQAKEENEKKLSNTTNTIRERNVGYGGFDFFN